MCIKVQGIHFTSTAMSWYINHSIPTCFATILGDAEYPRSNLRGPSLLSMFMGKWWHIQVLRPTASIVQCDVTAASTTSAGQIWELIHNLLCSSQSSCAITISYVHLDLSERDLKIIQPSCPDASTNTGILEFRSLLSGSTSGERRFEVLESKCENEASSIYQLLGNLGQEYAGKWGRGSRSAAPSRCSRANCLLLVMPFEAGRKWIERGLWLYNQYRWWKQRLSSRHACDIFGPSSCRHWVILRLSWCKTPLCWKERPARN